MASQADAAAARLRMVGDDIKGGLSKGFVLISLDSGGLPEYTIYTRGDASLRLAVVGALHEAISILLAQDVDEMNVPASQLN